MPHPRFSENRWLYLTYSKACEKGATTALLRGRFDGKALTEAKGIMTPPVPSAGPTWMCPAAGSAVRSL